MTKTLSDIASKSLGDSTSYAVYTDQFDPSLLNPMPRSLARSDWDIDNSLIGGFDRWNCHEATFLLNNGQPISGTLSFVYSALSEFMVESKSMKLYLNTFDMCRLGDNVKEASDAYVNQVIEDLSNVLKTTVKAYFHWSGEMVHSMVSPIHTDSRSLDALDFSGTAFTDFKGESNHVEALDMFPIKHTFAWHTHVLRSRCRHTKQKDTGSAAILYTGTSAISPVSVMKQIVSLREVNEFHEFCAEKLLVEIAKKVPAFSALSVGLFYSRRGSLDINPVRWMVGSQCGERYKLHADPSIYMEKTQGQ